ncbi:colipase-like [Stegostoma tigrinum]|uniref:colipase-like n=1 Tax=Stegostoma tigrinum TaxID=3053191 RepID=UPI00202B106B|nr:colipase-like [Stegostoma tigrinum]
MKVTLVFLACCIAVGIAAPERGLFLNLSNGELCIGSFQCKSGCCQRDTGLSLARCASKSAERDACSSHLLYNVYYKCPCENGLKCDGDKTIIGSITNTNFGICKDPNDIAKVIKPDRVQ